MTKKHSSITFKLINHDHQNRNVTENNIITSGKQPSDNIKKRMKNKKIMHCRNCSKLQQIIKIKERGKIDNPKTQIHDPVTFLSWHKYQSTKWQGKTSLMGSNIHLVKLCNHVSALQTWQKYQPSHIIEWTWSIIE